jgi:hypothetical protein
MPAASDVLAHILANIRKQGLKDFVRNARIAKGVAKNAWVGAAMKYDTVHGYVLAINLADAMSEGIEMNPVMAPQECSIDVEEIGFLFIPTETILNVDLSLIGIYKAITGCLTHCFTVPFLWTVWWQAHSSF